MTMNAIDLSWRTANKARTSQANTPFSVVAARRYRWHPPGWTAGRARNADDPANAPRTVVATDVLPPRR